MKKIITIIFTCFIYVNSGWSQLNGSVFLSGQANHSGIKAKFISNGGTAVTDSTFSDTAGNYTINITGGVYKVIFSKSGFLDVNYNSGTGVLLTNTTTLNSATLAPGNQVNVSGTVSGQWTNNNTYIVTGDMNVVPGQTLTIQAGTIIKFNSGCTFSVSGSVIANGYSGNPILFTSALSSPAPGNWKWVRVTGEGSVFAHCIFEYFTRGLDISNCSPVVHNNEFRKFNGIAIYATQCSSNVSQNWIHDFYSSDFAQGITYDNCPQIIVGCNKIHDGGGYGIRPYGGGIVKNNVIFNITSSQRGYAIGCGSSSTGLIENNYLHDCKAGFWILESILPIPHPRIINNTIANMSEGGILLHGFYSDADIINNIFLNCNKGIFQDYSSSCGYCSTTPSVVANNLMWNNSTGNYVNVQITGIGSVVSTNAQNNPVDPYFNMSLDPKFVNNLPPELASGSPCINAGKSGYYPNIGYDKFKSCNGLEVALTENEKETNLPEVFPNPFDCVLNIRFNLNGIEKPFMELIDVASGKVVSQKWIESASQITQLNTTDLSNGIYLLSLKTSGAPQVYYKLVKLN
jgi:hypothetical protein